MADIHVLTGNMVSGRKVMKTYAFHYAIDPLDQVAEASQDPDLVGFVSAVPNISQQEIADIKAGEIVEHVEIIEYNMEQTDQNIVTEVRAKYAELAPEITKKYGEKYRQYLTALAA